MARSQFEQFLREATYNDPESDHALAPDVFYGLYTSWCYISQSPRHPEDAFWAAMADFIRPGQCLRMKGPAALDYIVSSYPAVV